MASVAPAYSPIEELIHALTAGLGIIACAVAIPWLAWVSAGDAARMVAALVFGASALAMFVTSVVYHSAREPERKLVLRKFDHAAIYLLIAGTYTPITLVAMRNTWGWVLFGAIWALALLFGLDQLGFDVTALVAGLGIGGIAVALAVQNILGDLFASAAIVLDKPFMVGDFIVVGTNAGTVEKVGLKTTRVRSLSGEQLVFTNAQLLNSQIRNFKRMQERRIAFSIGVTYETPLEKLRQIPAWLKAAVESRPQARFDRAHFKEYAEFSLAFEIVYYVLSADYAVYMDRQQAINLALFEKFAAEGVAFAYPTRTLYIRQEAAAGR